MCSATNSVWNRLMVSGSVNIDWVLFCALYPGPPALPLMTNVPSPEEDQFVEPSPPTRPSHTNPFVWLIWWVDDWPSTKCVLNAVGFLATPESSSALSCLP